MDKAHNLAARAANAMKSGKPSQTTRIQAGPKVSANDCIDAVSRCFAAFQATWPRKFASIWPDSEAVKASKRVWFEAFRDSGLTLAKLYAGLDAVRFNGWPPDNPGEFLKLCRLDPEAFGAPRVEAAFAEAIRGSYPFERFHRWSHKAVYWAAVRTGMDELNERQQAMAKAFDREYQRALEELDQLDEPPVGSLPKCTHQINQAEADQAAADSFAEIRRMLAGSS